MNISAIIITRNEEHNIKECLTTLGFANEIIVIDNGSCDQTVDIAQKYKARVFKINGLDFSYLRNIGKEKAKGNWLFYIDADERVPETLGNEIGNIVSKTDYTAFYLLRVNYYLGTLWPKKEKMIRLMKKEALIGWQGILHESPIVRGKIGLLETPLLHYTHADLASMIEKTNEWSEIEAQSRFKANHPQMSWWRFFRVMISSFWHSYIQEGGWRVGTVGLIESTYQSFSMFITYAKLWERQNSRGAQLRDRS